MDSPRPKCQVCYTDCSSLQTKRVVTFPFSGFDLLATFVLDCKKGRTWVRQVHLVPQISVCPIVELYGLDLRRIADELFQILSKKESRVPNWKWKLRWAQHPQNVLDVYNSEVQNLFNVFTVLMTTYRI